MGTYVRPANTQTRNEKNGDFSSCTNPNRWSKNLLWAKPVQAESLSLVHCFHHLSIISTFIAHETTTLSIYDWNIQVIEAPTANFIALTFITDSVGSTNFQPWSSFCCLFCIDSYTIVPPLSHYFLCYFISDSSSSITATTFIAIPVNFTNAIPPRPLSPFLFHARHRP